MKVAAKSCLLIIFCHLTSGAAIIHVPADFSTIQLAINAANFGDVILVAPGTYNESDSLKSGITILSEEGPDSTIINGGGLGSVLKCDGDSNVTISGFTITGGNVSYQGGGVFCRSSQLDISDCGIVANKAFFYNFPGPAYGGGIYSENSTISVSNSLISGNSASTWGFAYGGGIYCDTNSSIRIKHCILENNSASGDYFGLGGGLCSFAPSSILDSNVISANVAVSARSYYTKGGGVYLSSSGASVRWNIIKLNEARAYFRFTAAAGGGVYAEGANLYVYGNTFYSNSASAIAGTYAGPATGGGLHFETGNLTLLNNIFAGNICFDSCENKDSCVFTSKGGGVYAGGTISPDCNDYNANYVNGALENTYGVSWGGNDFEANPRFCSPDSQDFYLKQDSPCLSKLGCGQVGAFGSGCPSGPLTIYVDCENTAGPWDGSQLYPFRKIQEGIDAAVTGDTVFVAPCIYYENDTLKSGIILLSEKGADSTIIDGQDSAQFGSTVLFCDTCDNARVIGFSIKTGYTSPPWPLGMYRGVGFNRCNNLEFKFNRVFANAGTSGPLGAYLVGDSMLIYGNLIAGNTLKNIGLSDKESHSGTQSAFSRGLKSFPRTSSHGSTGVGIYVSGTGNVIDSNIIDGNFLDVDSPGGKGVGLHCLGSFSTISRNEFIDNFSISSSFFSGDYSTSGIGLYLDSRGSLVEDNIFKSNRIDGYNLATEGVGLYVNSDSCVIKGNMFESNRGICNYKAAGSGAYIAGIGNRLEDNMFLKNSLTGTNSQGRGAGVSVTGEGTQFVGNVLAYNRCDSLGTPALGGGIFVAANSCMIQQNTIYANKTKGRYTPYSEQAAKGGGAYLAGSGIVFANNIVAGNSADCADSFSCAVLTIGGGGVACTLDVTLDCNDFYENYADSSANHIYGCSPGANDFFLDPLLCLPESLDFHLVEYSPCADDSFCGLIGALPDGCGICLAKPGDANASGTYTLGDVISIVNYIFNKDGCTVKPLCWLSNLLCRGDWNCDGKVTLSDVIRAVNYIFNKPCIPNPPGCWDPLPCGLCCQ